MAARVFAVLVGVVTLVVANVAPASAEFFGCNEPRTKVSYSSGYRSHYAQAPAASRSYTSQPSQRRVAPQWRTSQWH
jgi:hypothetical protein